MLSLICDNIFSEIMSKLSVSRVFAELLGENERSEENFRTQINASQLFLPPERDILIKSVLDCKAEVTRIVSMLQSNLQWYREGVDLNNLRCSAHGS